MEIRTIEEVPKDLDIDRIEQYCNCSYNGKTVEFKVIRNELGIFDDIMFPTDEGEYDYEYSLDDADDEDIQLILGAIDQGDYVQALKAHPIGLEFRMNHESIKPSMLGMHFPKPYYYDERNGPIVVTLTKNDIILNDE